MSEMDDFSDAVKSVEHLFVTGIIKKQLTEIVKLKFFYATFHLEQRHKKMANLKPISPSIRYVFHVIKIYFSFDR